MEKLIINGPTPLKGEVQISGAKNAAVAILPATLLIDGICTIENLPNISDVKISCKILEKLGAKITWNTQNSVTIDTRNISTTKAPLDLTSKFRASYYIIGAMLGRKGEIEVGMPGGCKLGARPIDQHIKGFESLGATVKVGNGTIHAKANKLLGTSIYMDIVSVGATINIMLSAVLANGTTTIDNAAKEPHVVDVANFLNTMGADIHGAGTDVIKVTGVKKLHGDNTYSIVPDQIEAGTFMIAAAATRGDVVLKNVIPRHLEIISAKLIEAGVNISEGEDSVRVWVNDDTKFKHINFIAMPYPGFPTDMQPQLVTFLTTIEGTSMAREGVWDNRFRYVNELKRMGADIRVEGKLAIIDGVNSLIGAHVKATDLRAGAAMIIAGLMAEGTTEITDIYHIDRGYENFEEKFVNLGGSIERVQVVDDLLD